jgi:hypothetical protein
LLHHSVTPSLERAASSSSRTAGAQPRREWHGLVAQPHRGDQLGRGRGGTTA